MEVNCCLFIQIGLLLACTDYHIVGELKGNSWNRLQSGIEWDDARIVKTEDVLGSRPRIENHRIGVYHIYQRYVEGNETPEEIAASHDISSAEVHTALAYMFSNPDEMHAIEAQNQKQYEETAATRVSPNESP